MKRIIRYNEAANEGQFYTWDELVFKIETGDVDLVESDKVEVLDIVNGHINFRNSRDSEFHNSTMVPRNGILCIGGDSVVVFDKDNAPITILTEYEMGDPTMFCDIVVLPGHDSITLYNRLTGEHKVHYHR